MKKLLLIVAGLALVSLPMSALAGVAGSDHDLTGGGQKLCEACHTPHNAQGASLWASAPSGTFTGVADLCYTCHDGSVTTVGSGTAFNTGGRLVSETNTSNDVVADRGGLPASVTFTVNLCVPGPAASAGVQLILPLELTVAPDGAETSV